MSWLPARAVGGPEWATDGTVEVEVTVRNDPGPAGDRGRPDLPVRSGRRVVVRPDRWLVAGARVDGPPARAAGWSFTVHADLTSSTGLADRRIVEPGVVELAGGRLERRPARGGGVRLTGPVRQVGGDRVLNRRSRSGCRAVEAAVVTIRM